MNLFHISFNGDLEGIWHPRAPDGEYPGITVESEKNFKRICTSPTIEQCFWAIYPNVNLYFEKEHYPYMDFYVYSPNLVGIRHTGLITPEEMRDNQLVPDAHITMEYGIPFSVQMDLVGAVRIPNCIKNPEVRYRKFDDPKMEERFLAHRASWKRKSVTPKYSNILESEYRYTRHPLEDLILPK